MPLRGVLARPDAVRRLGDEPVVLLEMGEDRTLDTAALDAALGEPRDVVETGVSVTSADVMGGLGLWLALREPDMGQLSALGKAAERGLVPALVTFPGMTLTSVLVGQRCLAALIRPDPAGVPADQFDLRVQLFGRGDEDLARRLTEQVQAWDATGRPSTADLRISAYPQGSADDDQTPMVVDTQHARLLLDW